MVANYFNMQVAAQECNCDVYCKPQVACIGIVVAGCYNLSYIDQTERYGKEHYIESKGLTSTKWAIGYAVFVGCAAVIYLIPMSVIYFLYAIGYWKEKVKLYLYTVSDYIAIDIEPV